MTAPTIVFVFVSGSDFRSRRQELVERAVANGYEVNVVTPTGTEDIERYPHHTIPLNRRSTNPLRELPSIRALASLYRRLQPTLVHHFAIKPIVDGGFAARVAGIPNVVHHFTGLGYTWTYDTLKTRTLRFGLGTAIRLTNAHPQQRFVFQNPDDRDHFVSNNIVSQRDSRVIRSSGIDIEQYGPLPEPETTPTIILPTRMLWAKGVAEFVNAAEILQQRNIEARCVLVGREDPGNPDAIPRTQLEAWDKNSAIEWLGYREDMVTTYGKSHIVCLPSYYREGVPQVALEGAACGRPVVTTDAPGCREGVRDGETGFLVPPRDAESLAEALERLINNPDLRKEMGRCGRQFIEEEFSREKVVDEVIAIYQDMLERPTDRIE